MRFSARIRVAVLAITASLLLCLAFVGSAFAFTVHPHISVTPHHIVTNAAFCGNVHLSGGGFTPSTNSNTNFADESLSDNNDPNGAYFAQTGTHFISIPVNNKGKFDDVLLTLCDRLTIFPGIRFTIAGLDAFTGLVNNSVQVTAS